MDVGLLTLRKNYGDAAQTPRAVLTLPHPIGPIRPRPIRPFCAPIRPPGLVRPLASHEAYAGLRVVPPSNGLSAVRGGVPVSPEGVSVRVAGLQEGF